MEKIITYTLTDGDGELITDNIEDIYVEIESIDVSDGQQVQFKLTKEKKYTREQLNNMPEWDGF